METSRDDETKPLFSPQSPEATRTFRFMQRVNSTRALSLSSYNDLYTWSTTEIDKFWGDVWDETDILGEKGHHVVDSAALPPENPPWFTEAKLNWAENMLRCRSPHKTALIEASMLLILSIPVNCFPYFPLQLSLFRVLSHLRSDV